MTALADHDLSALLQAYEKAEREHERSLAVLDAAEGVESKAQEALSRAGEALNDRLDSLKAEARLRAKGEA
jgi:hypothetical protein